MVDAVVLNPAICVQSAEEVVAIIGEDHGGEAEEQDHRAAGAADSEEIKCVVVFMSLNDSVAG